MTITTSNRPRTKPTTRSCFFALEQRLLQELHAGRPAGALLMPDGALDHLHVPVAPLLQALVKVRNLLEQVRNVRLRAVEIDQPLLNAFVRRARAAP